MRAAIYTRFSSALQDQRSLGDQEALCRARAESEGWEVVAVFADAAISGAAMHNRPGLLDMMIWAKERRIDIVVTEAIDRLSRDLEDIAGLHKQLTHWGVKIVTLADGAIDMMHVGLKGLISNLYLVDLAQKTRRGQLGRARAGRIPGGLCFGYRVVPGEEKGLREIDPAEEAILKRIFDEYVAGRSPVRIASGLNSEGIPGPGGRQWNQSAINGSAKRANGIISNRLYIGELVYNRQKFVKDPQTGKRVSRLNPRSEWLIVPVPELAIIDRDVFEAAQARRAEVSQGPLTQRTKRPKHLLSGKAVCGLCGGPMTVVHADRVGCSAKRYKGTCTNNRTISLNEIERRVVEVLQGHLLAPEIVDAAVEAYRQERARLAAQAARSARDAQRELAGLDAKINRLVEAIESSDDPRALVGRLDALEAERRRLQSIAPPPAEVVTLHPNAARRYADKVRDISAALQKGDTASLEAVALVRELIDRIIVTPGGSGEPNQLEVQGDLAVMVEQTGTDTSAAVGCTPPQPPIAYPGLKPRKVHRIHRIPFRLVA